MALPSAGNPISFKQINTEIGNSAEATLDLETAAETFGDTKPHGMNELLGQSSARLQLTIKYLVQYFKLIQVVYYQMFVQEHQMSLQNQH
jgi:hypothetical protein